MIGAGAIDCPAPASGIGAAGIAREKTRASESASGEVVEQERGFARPDLLGDDTVVPILVGPEKAEPILGFLAAEASGVVVDPVNQTLKRVHASPLK